MVKVLAFDLATQTGAAVGSPDAAPLLITEKLGEPGDLHGPRFLQCMIATGRLIKEQRPDIVAIEEPIASGPVGNKNRAFVGIGLRACVLGVAHHHEVPVVEYGPGAVRAYFLGKMAVGKKRGALKGMIMAQCRKQGWEPANDDEGDAAALWAYAQFRQGTDLIVPYGAMI